MVPVKEGLTAEAQSSQRSENFLTKNSLLCVLSASAVPISESYFTESLKTSN
jgi:hypothetical protein